MEEASFLSEHPDLAEDWDYLRNWLENRQDPSYPARPEDISKNYAVRKVWWICDNGHRYLTTPYHRAMGTTCPYCYNLRYGSLHDLYPQIADEWDAGKNYKEHQKDSKWPATSWLVSACSVKKAWWICSKCGHSWCYRIGHRTDGSNAGRCPACHPRIHDGKNNTGRRRLIKGKTDLLTMVPDIDKIWDYDKNLEKSRNDIYVSYTS